MEQLLERVWEFITDIFGGLTRVVERLVTSLFGSSNARYIKKLHPKVEAISRLEPQYQAMSDEELRDQTRLFRERLAAGETLDDILPEAFAVCREGGVRFLGMRHYDVQMVGGMVLHGGNIAEMVTGEGKTLVATLPVYLNGIEGKGVHVVTVNDYLARRDMEWMGPLYMGLGLTVGTIWSGMENSDRQAAYACDITYGTNNEFGFDYLRDNMKPAARGDDHYPKHMQQAQGRLNFAVIDEVDNILIDEARTPLIISGAAHDDITKYAKADALARQLKKDTHFEVKEKEHTVLLTEEGIRAAEKIAGVESFYTAGNMEWPHLIDNSLKARFLYKADVNYVVQEGEVVIVDEFTGRLMPGRNWSDGLHQAVEAKEGVTIKQESQTLATITLQNFFKLYNQLAGMTGTAMTEASEFWKIYGLDVIAIPTNREMKRKNFPDLIYRTEREKYNAIVDEIEHLNKWDVLTLSDDTELLGAIVSESDEAVEFKPHDQKQKTTVPRSKIKSISHKGRPVLVGTVSIEKSEHIGDMLGKRGIKHEVLNAKYHGREAEIVAQAGRKGAVTIATNMAGRGTDIVLGGNPEVLAWGVLQEKYETRLDVPKEEWDTLVAEIDEREQMSAEGKDVAAIGGLHVVGTERHEARRIDLQLRGRCGRQGDPGSSRFFLSLEDDLMRIFAGDWVKNVLTRLGMQDGDVIESRMVSRRIEGAQKKVEERNFDVRKHLLEYDEVMDEQRKRVYGYRHNILDGGNCKQLLLDMIDEQIDFYLDNFLARDYATQSFAQWVSGQFSVEYDPRDFRGMDFASAEQFARDEAERQAEGQVLDSIEENLPDDVEASEWNWEALAKMANLRWKLNIRDRDLKKLGRDTVADDLIERAREAIRETNCAEGSRLLEPDFGLQTACAWVHHKFGITLELDEVRALEAADFKQMVRGKAIAAYEEKEAEYPVMAALIRYTTRDSGGQKRYDREGLVEWAQQRFHVEMSIDDLRNKQREEFRDLLVNISLGEQQKATTALAEVQTRVDQLFDGGDSMAGNGALSSLVNWADEQFDGEFDVDDFAPLDREEVAQQLISAVEHFYRPEIRRMERALVLQILDSAWKEHLLSMDHLRSSVGLRGYAQVDPKVEYKREGMRAFEGMWKSIGERVTDLIFKIDQLSDDFVSSVWVGGEATKASGPSASDIAQQQQSAIDSSGEPPKREPIRNRQVRVGRNTPCPCGSGKKFKNCCMRARGG